MKLNDIQTKFYAIIKWFIFSKAWGLSWYQACGKNIEEKVIYQ